MRVSTNWLKDWIDHGLDTQALADRLTMAGLEVDAIEAAAEPFTGIVVGEVVDIQPHPNADKLSLCQVSDGSSQEAVVCGAPNVFKGMRAPFAKVGAVLPGEFKIKKAKLRGEESRGMLCSAKELGLSEDAAGLMQLASDAPVGQDLRDYLSLDDQIIEIDLTPNRGDCLSMAGVAREVGALTGHPVCRPQIGTVDVTSKQQVAVSVADPSDCPSYLGQVITGIDTAAETPVWMSERLRRAGVRPISPVVDVTNYVMLELGQPMHGFRLEAINGAIRVRRAKKGEQITLLDDREVKLDEDILVIADEQGPVAMAGVMGGKGTAVETDTADVFLESACFAPEVIAGRARRFGLHTDASHRYERGVDPELQARALQRAASLIMEVAGGQAGPVTDARSTRPAPSPIRLRRDRLHGVLGFELDKNTVTGMLERLGMAVSEDAEDWQATAPSHRFDLNIEEDLIEEVARIHGYDRIPVVSLPSDVRPGQAPEDRVPESRVKALMVERGYQEVITYSFQPAEADKLLSGGVEGQKLANPISQDLETMRTTLWSGLTATLRHNANRQQARVRLFETGLRFIPQDSEIEQKKWVSGLAWGHAEPEQWDGRTRPVDFFDVKADVEALMQVGGPRHLQFLPERHPALHPGQCAQVWAEDKAVGWLGRIHPQVADTLDLPADAYLFELELAQVAKAELPAYQRVSRYPSLRRDLAFVVDEDLAAETLVATAREAAGESLVGARIFDVYQGKGVDSGRKSIALGLILQDSSRTLTDEDTDRVVSRVREELERRLGATVRD
ncbi:phenylalanyl-tRNA synthetase beta chain [Natronospira proteinivora]|uniref:Phenylalanine--tRNA ligase beta subunit n=1 Tax=Natronospira proteinivora TaxID=1807133 RepID=A0ABT1G7I5_9GAMM|nr:phenylalanine--tRNA ligase subunit beta [Natronospira proteinivora]MCP1726910.1 phenylalanyl-tRNA synthetase beta chain [Natronospira proteinivora]